MLDQATALHRAGRIDAAAELFDRLRDGATPPRVAASAQLERALLRISSGEGSVDEVFAAAERATTVFAELGDDAGLAQAWNSVATQLFWRGLVGQMEHAALRGREHARAAGDERQELWSVNALCIALAHGPTPAEEAARRCRELLARGEELGADALPLFTLAAVEGMCGRLEEAWELYDRGRRARCRRDPRVGVAVRRAVVRARSGPRGGRAAGDAPHPRPARHPHGPPHGGGHARGGAAHTRRPDRGRSVADGTRHAGIPARGRDDAGPRAAGRGSPRRWPERCHAREAGRRSRAEDRVASPARGHAGRARRRHRGEGTPLVEAAALWEAKGNLLAVRQLDMAASAR